MARRRVTILLALILACACAAATATAAYKGRACTPPSGHRIADCRTAAHGTPDLSRAAWRALRGGAEVTFSEQIDDLAGNPAAAGAPEWPLVDSLGQPIGRLISAGTRRFTVLGSDGTPYRVTSVRVRGRGCAASTEQQRRFTLVQVIAKAPSGGTQAFLDTQALNRSSPWGSARSRASPPSTARAAARAGPSGAGCWRCATRPSVRARTRGCPTGPSTR